MDILLFKLLDFYCINLSILRLMKYNISMNAVLRRLSYNLLRVLFIHRTSNTTAHKADFGYLRSVNEVTIFAAYAVLSDPLT